MELSVFPNLGDNPATDTFDLAIAGFWASSSASAQADLVAALQLFVALGGQLSWAETLSYTDAQAYADNLYPPPLDANTTDPNVYWEYKMGQYVSRPLSVDEFVALVDGVVSLPVLEKAPKAKRKDNGKPQPGFYQLADLEGYEGAMVAPAPTDTAFVHRSVGFDVVVDVFAAPIVPGALTAAVDWLRGLYQGKWAGFVGPAAYQNYPSPFYQPQRTALEQYYGENLCRLVGIKAKYDPAQVFGWVDEDRTGSNGSGNQGVPPSLPGC